MKIVVAVMLNGSLDDCGGAVDVELVVVCCVGC